MVDEKAYAFALRLRPELREAADLLTSSSGWPARSLNETLNQLIEIGLRAEIARRLASAAALQEEAACLLELLNVLIQNPKAPYVRPQDLKSGSAARSYLEKELQAFTAGDEFYEAGGLDRAEVARRYAVVEIGLRDLAKYEEHLERAMSEYSNSAPTRYPNPLADIGDNQLLKSMLPNQLFDIGKGQPVTYSSVPNVLSNLDNKLLNPPRRPKNRLTDE